MYKEINELSQAHETNLMELTGDIVSAYVSNNSVPGSELPALIRNVYAALGGIVAGTAQVSTQPTAETADKPTAAQIRKSVTPDGIVSFVDGKTYKTMKRHLTGHGFDPQSYRQRFGLPADYPMVASSYAAQRSALAKSIGLGRGGAREETEEPPPNQSRRKAA